MERDGPPGEEFARTELILDELRRSLAYQVQAKEAADARSSRLLQLGVVSFGGGVALGAFLLDPAGIGWSAPTLIISGVAALLIGLMLNLGAMIAFLEAYVGLSHNNDLVQGVDERWLADWARLKDWRLEHIQHSMIHSYVLGLRRNRRRFAAAVRPAAGACGRSYRRRFYTASQC